MHTVTITALAQPTLQSSQVVQNRRVKINENCRSNTAKVFLNFHKCQCHERDIKRFVDCLLTKIRKK